MKRMIILCLLLLSVGVHAQLKMAVLSLNLDEEQRVVLERNGRVPRMIFHGMGGEQLEAQQDRYGKWHFILPDPLARYANLTIWGLGQQMLYLASGMEMTLTVGADKRFHFDGDGADINNYLSDNNVLSGLSNKELTLSEDKLKKQLQEDYKVAVDVLQKAKLNKDFTALEQERLRLVYVNKLANYIGLYPLVNRKPYTPSAKFVDYIVSLFHEDENFMMLSEYQALPWHVINLKWKSPENIQNREDETLDKLHFILEHFQGAKLREHLIGTTVVSHIRNAGLKDTARIEPLFRRYVSDSRLLRSHDELRDKLTSDTDKILKNLSLNGKVKCPSFKFTDINGKEVAIEDFRGKYVYIDCWATWCGPCKAELPHLQKLEEKYKDRNIVFVSISSDKDRGVWEKMVKTDKLGGVQLNIGKDNSFHKAMKIDAIPRFILVDPEGYLVSDNATRPSNTQTEILFNSLKGL